MAARFCQRCGSELKAWQDEGQVRMRCPACGFVAYENPKPCAGVLITEGRRVLLARRAREPYAGKWDIVGGFLEADEPPDIAARREAWEETGLTVELIDVLSIHMDRYGADESTLNIYYVAHATGGTPRANDDVDVLQWFDADALPDDLAFPDHERAVLADWQVWLDAHQ